MPIPVPLVITDFVKPPPELPIKTCPLVYALCPVPPFATDSTEIVGSAPTLAAERSLRVVPVT